MKPDIIFEDAHVVVCSKPAGLAVQNASFGKMDLESMLRNELARKTGKANPYLGIVHRLDQPVQGIVVFAKTPAAAAALSAQVQNEDMEKCYLAVTDGIPKEENAKLVHFLKKEVRGNVSRVADASEQGAKKAVLAYRILEICENRTLLEIRLKTGRHHQIRVQMAANHTPLVGDAKYNRTDTQERQLALCAYRLRFRHPADGREMTFVRRPQGGAFSIFEQTLATITQDE